MFHNQFSKLDIPTNPEHKVFISLIKGLRECPLTYAITVDPEIHTPWIEEFWANAGIHIVTSRKDPYP